MSRQMAVATRVAPRWLAAAAAAGLFVGVAVGGMLFDSSGTAPTQTTLLARTKPVRRMTPPPVRVTSPASVAEPQPAPPAPPAQPQKATTDDDTFLSELENALQYRPRELQPYDALTPHVRDVSAQLR
jgi:hypothetical protein